MEDEIRKLECKLSQTEEEAEQQTKEISAKEEEITRLGKQLVGAMDELSQCREEAEQQTNEVSAKEEITRLGKQLVEMMDKLSQWWEEQTNEVSAKEEEITQLRKQLVGTMDEISQYREEQTDKVSAKEEEITRLRKQLVGAMDEISRCREEAEQQTKKTTGKIEEITQLRKQLVEAMDELIHYWEEIQPLQSDATPHSLDAYIRVLSDLIGQDWKCLARELGLSKTDIDALEYNNVRNLKEQICQFFHTWKTQEGNDASVEKLREGVRNAGLHVVEREAESKFREQSDLREKRLKRLGSSSDGPSLGVSRSISTASSSSDSTVTTDSPHYRTTRQPSSGSASSEGPQQSAVQQQCPDPTLSTDSPHHSQKPRPALRLQSDATPRSFEVGDMVMVERPDAAPWYGVIKYLGDPLSTGQTIAGLEIVSLSSDLVISLSLLTPWLSHPHVHVHVVYTCVYITP